MNKWGLRFSFVAMFFVLLSIYFMWHSTVHADYKAMTALIVQDSQSTSIKRVLNLFATPAGA